MSRYRKSEAEAMTALSKKAESSREDYFLAIQLDPGMAYERLKRLIQHGLAERSNSKYPALYRLTDAGRLKLAEGEPPPKLRPPKPQKPAVDDETDVFAYDFNAIVDTARKTQPTSIFDVCHIHALAERRRRWKKSLK